MEPIECRWYGVAGPQVVVLHGGPGAPGSAAGLCRVLASFGRVMEPLQRGSGPVPLSVALHVQDLERVAPERAIVVGHSWGAMLALSFATAHPDRVAAVVLVGCGTYDEDSRAIYQQAMSARYTDEARARREALREAIAQARTDDERNRLLLERARISMHAQSFDRLDDPEHELSDVDHRAHAETWADAMARQSNGTEPAAFASIACPVTMIHGADDPHPGPQTAAVLRRSMPQLRYVELPRCGHEPWCERHARAAFGDVLREVVLAASD